MRGTGASKAHLGGRLCFAPAGLSEGTADPVLSHLSVFQEDLGFFFFQGNLVFHHFETVVQDLPGQQATD